MRLIIQGARHRFVFRYGIKGRERTVPICNLGNLIYPGRAFRFIIHVMSGVLHVYYDGVLRFILPVSPLTSIERSISVRIYGSVTTQQLRVLTAAELVNELQATECGRGTSGISVPSFCPESAEAGRIVGGRTANPGEFPWQVSIRRYEEYTNSEPHICGGTLIGSQWVVTAAHCFPSRLKTARKKHFVRIGDFFNRDGLPHSRDPTVEGSRDIRISKIYKHDGYSQYPSARNDIALIKLISPAQFTRFIQPACLPSSVEQFSSGNNCGISGWGATNYTQFRSDYPPCLRGASVHIWRNQDCLNTYSNSFLRDTMMCAAGDGVDTCQGDSGGPLVCGRGDDPITLWGITSFGVKCGDRSKPGVYTKISRFMPWIYLKMKLHDGAKEVDPSSYYCQH
uniref:Peptidase S1 domain-containing protein n=1 Tax=Ciona savignyi TaxID=51511 RepID=H2YDU6_CIOSA